MCVCVFVCVCARAFVSGGKLGPGGTEEVTRRHEEGQNQPSNCRAVMQRALELVRPVCNAFAARAALLCAVMQRALELVRSVAALTDSLLRPEQRYCGRSWSLQENFRGF